LRRDGVTLRLEPQPAKVLAVLIRNAGQVVARAELATQVWGSETFVDFEQGLNYAIRRIRIALEDLAESPRFLETLPKKGYRFIAPIANEPVDRSEEEPTLPAESSAQNKPQRHSRRLLIWAGVGLLSLAVIALGALAALKYGRRPVAASGDHRIQSIAVLPLHNLSQNRDQEYFSEGMTDELTTVLAKVDGLRVISHSSVERYKEGTTPLPQIARELGVDAVVEGTVMQAGNRVRITTQLIDARTDTHLWAESYERELPDVLALQDALAHDIAEEIRPRVAASQDAHATAAQKTDPEAFDAYLRGRYLWNQRNPEFRDKEIEYFQSAIVKDPGFALAYSGLADCYVLGGWGSKLEHPLPEQYAIAEQYARKAVSLAPDLPEGHVSLGSVLFRQRRFIEAKNELRRAIELNPNYSMAHHFQSAYLFAVGLKEDALAENERALQLDPFGVAVNSFRVMMLTDLKQFAQALEQAERLTEIANETPNTYKLKARIYWLQDRIPEAIESERKFGVLSNLPRWVRDQDELSALYSRGEEHVVSLRAANLMERDRNALEAAYQYARVQNRDKTLQNLKAAWPVADPTMEAEMKYAPEFEFLQGDPKYVEFLSHVNVR